MKCCWFQLPCWPVAAKSDEFLWWRSWRTRHSSLRRWTRTDFPACRQVPCRTETIPPRLSTVPGRTSRYLERPPVDRKADRWCRWREASSPFHPRRWARAFRVSWLESRRRASPLVIRFRRRRWDRCRHGSRSLCRYARDIPRFVAKLK